MEWAQAAACHVGLVSLFGAVISLDRRNAFQAMLSQPLILVSILGCLFGQVEQAVWLGSLLQLLWMSSVLFGANVPENDTIASVIIAGTYFLFSPETQMPNSALFCLVVLLGVPFSGLGRRLDIKLDGKNLDLVERADAMAKDGSPNRLFWLAIVGLTRAMTANGLLVAAGLSLSLLTVHSVVPYLPLSVVEGLAIAGMYILPSLGLAVALTLLRKRRAMALATITFSIVVLLLNQGR